LKEKQHNIGFLFSNCLQVLILTDPLNIIFDDFGISLLG